MDTRPEFRGMRERDIVLCLLYRHATLNSREAETMSGLSRQQVAKGATQLVGEGVIDRQVFRDKPAIMTLRS